MLKNSRPSSWSFEAGMCGDRLTLYDGFEMFMQGRHIKLCACTCGKTTVEKVLCCKLFTVILMCFNVPACLFTQ